MSLTIGMDLIGIINSVEQEATKSFSGLTQQQLNWKPEPQKWSIAQCLQHLIISNKTYFPTFDKIIQGTYRLGFFQKLNPFKKIVGAYMVKHLGPQPTKKFKTPSIFQPSFSEVDSDILTKFSKHQEELKNYFHHLENKSKETIYMTSPVTPFIAYSLAHAMQILAVHEQRHLNQALNVLNHPNFSK